MFVNQGAVQFELWTGEKAPLDVMKSAVESALQRV
jgi:shikimate dehydrogenase